MSAFANENLFASGPHRFHVGGVSLRHVLHETPNPGGAGGLQGRGVQLTNLGRQGRAITQRGDLVADSLAALRALAAAIEAKLDGLAHELVDDLGRTWPDVVMLTFEPQPPEPLGRRWRMSYRVQYLQVVV